MFNPITWVKDYLARYNYELLKNKKNRTPQEDAQLEREKKIFDPPHRLGD